MQRIPCPTCEGKGEVNLPEWGREIMGLIRGAASVTAYDLVGKIASNISPNGVNNRLERLRGLGLLQRVRDGKSWLYSRPSK